MKIKALMLGALLLAVPAFGQPIQTIRVAPLYSTTDYSQSVANLVTAKLISHLAANGVSVVEGRAHADATLKVGYVLKFGRLEGPIRLTSPDGRVLWAEEVRAEHSGTSSYAETVAIEVEKFLYKQR